jgi:predicted DNA-binding transcriptional regulator YafY
MLAILRQAMMTMHAVRFRYLGGSKPGAWRTVCPYGILFERMNYLIAAETGTQAPRSWRLDRIRDVELTDIPASPPRDFDLEEFASQSFGIYQDAPEEVVLKVRPEAAEEALNWRFHVSQTLERQGDGSLLVRFRSGGMLELAWHLFTWETKIEILEPPRLRALLLDKLQQALTHHRPETPSCERADPRGGEGAEAWKETKHDRFCR